MNFLEEILYLLSPVMERPGNYGWFHLMWIGITTCITILLCVFFSKASIKKEKVILLVVWIIIVLFEIYKQLLFSVNFGETVTWDYQWYAFPFQLCSSPLYIIPLALISKEGKFRDAALMFLATFAFFGGLVVYIYPNDVFIEYIGINIQTMIHHGSQIVLGILIAVRLCLKNKMTIKNYLNSVLIFISMVAVAFLLNIWVPTFTDETFNMFYIGPKYPCSLVIVGDIYSKVPYPVFLLIYIIGFSLIALLFFGIYRLILFLCKTIKMKKKS